MKRNENGYGTVVCLDKSGKKRKKPYAVRITVGWIDGKQKTKYLGYYETAKEAKLALAQYHLQGLNYDFNTVTFGQIFDLWKAKRSAKLTEKNLASYVVCFKHLGILHNRKFKDIKTAQLQSVMDSLDFKYATKNKVKTLMNQMYEVAIENDLALKNYASFVDVNSQQEEVGTVFTQEEITHLWSLSGKNELVDDLLILIYTGVRISEAFSITKPDIHLEDRYIELHGTKTQAADRIIPIHNDILPLIEARVQCNKQYLLERRGTKHNYRAFGYNFSKLMTELNWEHRIHDTRKTTVTNMYTAGIPMEVIKFIVGHSQTGVTADTYLKLKDNAPLFVENINKMVLRP